MAERKPPKDDVPERKPSKPPAESPPPPEPTPPSKLAKRLAKNWRELNAGGAPVSPEFVQAALDQGLTTQDVRAVLQAQALGGPRTSASFSSPELLDYFTANPTEISPLLDAVRSTADAPANYAEYLARGGEPGGYRSANQLLQEAVLGIGGARDAYLAGTHRQMFIDEGNDPRRWVMDREEWMNQFNEDDGGDATAAINDLDMNSLTTLSDAASKMLSARQARRAAYGETFQLGVEEE